MAVDFRALIRGFRTPAPWGTVVRVLGPAFESLPRRKPWGGRALFGGARPMEICRSPANSRRFALGFGKPAPLPPSLLSRSIGAENSETRQCESELAGTLVPPPPPTPPQSNRLDGSRGLAHSCEITQSAIVPRGVRQTQRAASASASARVSPISASKWSLRPNQTGSGRRKMRLAMRMLSTTAAIARLQAQEGNPSRASGRVAVVWLADIAGAPVIG